MKNKERIYNSYEQDIVGTNVVQAFKQANFVWRPKNINWTIIIFLNVDRTEAKSVKYFIQKKIVDPTAPQISLRSIKLDCPFVHYRTVIIMLIHKRIATKNEYLI